MENESLENKIPAESSTSTDQQDLSTGTYKQGVFLMRAKGQSFDDFKDYCVAAFRKAGLIKD